jgi:hypothetical protein
MTRGMAAESSGLEMAAFVGNMLRMLSEGLCWCSGMRLREVNSMYPALGNFLSWVAVCYTADRAAKAAWKLKNTAS